MKKLLSIALALSALSAPALARDHWDGGRDRGYGYVHADRGGGYYNRGYDRGGYYGRGGNGGGYYGRGGGYGYRDSCRGSNLNGTILGAVAGGVIGNAASPYDPGRGTVIGGLLGGVLGNRIDASSGRCRY